MRRCKRVLVLPALVLAMAVLAPVTFAQKPPGGGPPPPSRPPAPPPGQPTNTLPGSDATQPKDDLVLYLTGRVATGDGSPVPSGVMVERICNNRVRQQVYPFSRGEFSMQLGGRTDSFMDASGDGNRQSSNLSRDPTGGIPRRELTNCELRASAPGFHSELIDLMGLDPVASGIDVGVLVMRRGKKVEGATLDARPYQAPKEASRAYEKGLKAETDGKLPEAREYFAAAVKIYPSFAIAWFRLGGVLRKENQNDGARKAFTEATTIDVKFLQPYLALASMAYEAGKWTDVLDLTRHILNLDPWRHAEITGYILDLDALDYGEAYFYNAYANFKLNKIEEAEKSGLKAERIDLRTRFPRVHLLLAEIFARRSDYARAISQMKIYLELVPHAADVDQVRERLAKLERLNDLAAAQQ
jgi:tetratricopeptide (TPR) repeat protein